MAFALERDCRCCMSYEGTIYKKVWHCKDCWEKWHCDERKGMPCDYVEREKGD